MLLCCNLSTFFQSLFLQEGWYDKYGISIPHKVFSNLHMPILWAYYNLYTFFVVIAFMTNFSLYHCWSDIIFSNSPLTRSLSNVGIDIVVVFFGKRLLSTFIFFSRKQIWLHSNDTWISFLKTTQLLVSCLYESCYL